MSGRCRVPGRLARYPRPGAAGPRSPRERARGNRPPAPGTWWPARRIRSAAANRPAPAASARRAVAEVCSRGFCSNWRPASARAATSVRRPAQVGGTPVGCDHPDRRLRAARPEAGQHDRRVHAGQPGAELAAHGRGGHDQVAAQRVGIAPAQREQPRRRDPGGPPAPRTSAGHTTRSRRRIPGRRSRPPQPCGPRRPPGWPPGWASRRGLTGSRRRQPRPRCSQPGPRGPDPAGLRVSAMVIAPAPNSTAARTSTVSTRHRARAGQ